MGSLVAVACAVGVGWHGYLASIYQGTKAVTTTKTGEKLATGVNAIVVDNNSALTISIGFSATIEGISTATENTSVVAASGIDVWIDVPSGMNYVVWWVSAGSDTFELGQGART